MNIELHWETMNDTEFARLLRNSEGRDELERSMFLEAARRIAELHDAADESLKFFEKHTMRDEKLTLKLRAALNAPGRNGVNS